jgi:phage gp29-like protein
LVRPFIDLEYGPQKTYPRLIIGRPEEEDLKAFAEAVAPLIDRGLKIKQSEVYTKFGLSAPDEKDEILAPAAKSTPSSQPAPPPETERAPQSAIEYPFNTLEGISGMVAALQAQSPSAGVSAAPDKMALWTGRMAKDADPTVNGMIERIELMLAQAPSLEAFRENLLAGFPNLDANQLAEVLAMGMVAAHAAGRTEIEDEADD